MQKRIGTSLKKGGWSLRTWQPLVQERPGNSIPRAIKFSPIFLAIPLIVCIMNSVEAGNPVNQKGRGKTSIHYSIIMKNPILLTLGSLLLASINLSAATLYVSPISVNPRSPYASWTTAAATIQAAVSSAVAGDFIVVTDGVYAGEITVSNPVTMLSVNGANVTVIKGGEPPCISLTNSAILIGFTVTGAGDYKYVGGGIQCSSASSMVMNCIISNNFSYEGAGVNGGTLNNCVLTDNNGTSGGAGAGASGAVLNNCVLTDNHADAGAGAAACTLNYCTVVGNGADTDGGGADDSTLNYCILIKNSAGAGNGGGVWECTLNNCLLCTNNAVDGGGAANCTLNNCTLTGNSAGPSQFPSATGGGAYDCTLSNCICYFNTVGNSSSGVNYDSSSFLSYCCATPLPASGNGNIIVNPLFVNTAVGNFQLQSTSPCINSGNNADVNSPTDLAGNPRIVGGTVDIGAYEYQGSGSAISYAYLQEYDLPTDGSVDSKDLDGTGFDVYEDWIAGLNPTNPSSVLAMLPPLATNHLAGITVRWQSVNGVQYLLQRSTNLAVRPVFPTIQNIPGQSGTTSYLDSSATNKTPYYYRVGVIAP
jgi:hypothetical protein